MLSTVVFLILSVPGAASTNGRGPFRGTCKREAFFEKFKDMVLMNHVIAIYDVTSDLECARQCVHTSGCKSYNYQETGSPLHKCELNDQTKTSRPSDYVIKAGFSYHDAEHVATPNRCSSSPCQNGGTCSFLDCTDSFQCLCKPEYTGRRCETWFGFSGSTSNLPGKSCLNIKLLGEDTGDRRYWIDPKNTGNPFTVYCDMTTDEGGWTLIRNVTLLSPSTNEYEEFRDYRRITNLTAYQFVHQPGLLELKKDMGFTQIRYYCRKVSVGRVFHIMTAKTNLGFDVVRYLVVNGSTFPTACNSFVRLPDDNSILAANCDKWGHSKDNKNMTNKWGCSPYIRTWRPYNRPVTWFGVRLVSFIDGEYLCDDNKPNKPTGEVGDVWKMFVR